MIEQPQAPRTQYQERQVENPPKNNPVSNHDSEFETLLREVKQLRQDVQFLKQLLEHVQSQLN